MRKRTKTVRVSAGEMELLSLLWNEAPVTIAGAHRLFEQYGNPIGYPTMQTRLNRLVEKKLASKSDDRPATYRAAVSVDKVAAGHLDQLLDKLAGASVAPLVCHLISERPLTRDEIGELRKLLVEAEKASTRK